ERRIGREPGAPGSDSINYLGITNDGVANQPVEPDRVVGIIDHPADQIAARAGRRWNARLIVRENKCAVGREGELAVDRQKEDEVRLFADVGVDVFDGRADPVTVNLSLL